MKSLRIHWSPLVLLIVIVNMVAIPIAEAKEKGPTIEDFEKYVGEYYPCGSYTAELAKVTKVQIVRDKDALIIKGAKPWQRCRFIVQGKNKLSDLGGESRIGSLVPGEIKFPDGNGSRKVLRADFCYDYFVFVRSAVDQ